MSHPANTSLSKVASLRSLEALANTRSADDLRDTLTMLHPSFELKNLHELAIVGASGEGERLVRQCTDAGIAVRGIYDQNPNKLGEPFLNHVVEPLEALASKDRALPVIVASHRGMDAVRICRRMGFASTVQLALLQVLYPDTFTPHMFYDGWLEDLVHNTDEYSWLATTLGDAPSHMTLDAILQYRMTLDIMTLETVLDEDVWHSADMVRYPHNGVYIDGGAYDGDTVRKYISKSHGQFARIIAFEPDPDTYGRLTRNFADEPRVEPVRMGLYREKSVLRFSSAASRASLLHEEGDIEVPVTSIDEHLNGDPVTFIKMNIEGAELAALQGAANSIRAYRPTMAISAYHAPSHLWQVAKVILEIYPGYQLYLRQQDGGSVETVLYALPSPNENVRDDQ